MRVATYAAPMTDTEAPGGPTTGPGLPVGTRVEVRSDFDGSWESGFVVEAVTDRGYRLRRESDGAELPELPHQRVRRRRSRSTWWV